MAFGRLERTSGPQPMSEINMTPLIDVMLVLLVIFMITAPLMTSSLKLDLPQSDAAQPSEAPKFIAVAILADGELYLGDEKLAPEAFDARLADGPADLVNADAARSRHAAECVVDAPDRAEEAHKRGGAAH